MILRFYGGQMAPWSWHGHLHAAPCSAWQHVLACSTISGAEDSQHAWSWFVPSLTGCPSPGTDSNLHKRTAKTLCPPNSSTNGERKEDRFTRVLADTALVAQEGTSQEKRLTPDLRHCQGRTQQWDAAMMCLEGMKRSVGFSACLPMLHQPCSPHE